jgi:hypothetical protein
MWFDLFPSFSGHKGKAGSTLNNDKVFIHCIAKLLFFCSESIYAIENKIGLRCIS